MKTIEYVIRNNIKYFCDICAKDITKQERNVCEICGRISCSKHGKTIKGKVAEAVYEKISEFHKQEGMNK